MSETQATLYSNKVSILAELWMGYRNDVEFQDFIEYNDLGLPLAYAINEDIVKSTDLAKRYIEETFDLFIAGLELEDEGFENLDDVLSTAADEEIAEE